MKELNALLKLHKVPDNTKGELDTLRSSVITKADKTYVDAELAKKETPAGAQTKATQALNDAKAYAEPKFAKNTGFNKALGTTAGTVAEGNHAHSSYVNQNAFSNVKVGAVTVAADTITDTLEIIAGTNVTIAADAATDKLTISSKDTVYVHPNDANNRHVTDAEKNGWNAKETPAGAQAKADKTLADSKVYADTKVAELVNTAPEALDTLNELAAALGNDPNFATTIAVQIGTKSDKTYVDAELAKKETPTGAQTKATQALNDAKAYAEPKFTKNNAFNKTFGVDAGTVAEGNHSHASYVNQNAFSKIKVGTTIVDADSVTDTLELVAGANITLTPDATNDKVTIVAKDTVYTHPNDANTRHVTDAEKNGWNAKSDKTYVDAELAKKANVSHGNHVPAVQTADARKFLRNDNSWQALPIGTTAATGIVQLNDAVNSASTAQAATANAVKTTYDLANSKTFFKTYPCTAAGWVELENGLFSFTVTTTADDKKVVDLIDADEFSYYIVSKRLTATSFIVYSDEAVTGNIRTLAHK